MLYATKIIGAGVTTIVSAELPNLAPNVLWEWGSFKFTETMFSGAVTIGILIILAALVRIFCIPRWRAKLSSESGLQILIESFVDGVESNCEELVYHHTNGRHKFLSFWFFSVVCYIFLGTMIEMTGLRSPTASLSMTIAFALYTFVFIHALGLYESGEKKQLIRRILSYINPIKLVTDGVVPFSMALRLFISVFSGFLIMHLIYNIPLPLGFPAIGNVMFTLFHAVIQSYVFFILSISFISEAVE